VDTGFRQFGDQWRASENNQRWQNLYKATEDIVRNECVVPAGTGPFGKCSHRANYYVLGDQISDDRAGEKSCQACDWRQEGVNGGKLLEHILEFRSDRVEMVPPVEKRRW
jgi:hypothetical protein